MSAAPALAARGATSTASSCSTSPKASASNAALQRVRRAFQARKAGPHREPRPARERPAADLPGAGHQGERRSCWMPTRPIGSAWRSAASTRDRRPRGRNRRDGAGRRSRRSSRSARSGRGFPRRIDAGSADVFGPEARRPAALSAGACRRRGRTRAAPRADRSPGTARRRPRLARFRGRLQQGHLCPQPCRRPRARPRNGWSRRQPCGGSGSARSPSSGCTRSRRSSRLRRPTRASRRCCWRWMRPCRACRQSSSGSRSRRRSCRDGAVPAAGSRGLAGAHVRGRRPLSGRRPHERGGVAAVARKGSWSSCRRAPISRA